MSDYFLRMRSARRWVAATAVGNLPFLFVLSNQVPDRKGNIWLGLLEFDLLYLALLVAYALLLGTRPRPWLAVGMTALALLDAAVWVPVLLEGVDQVLLVPLVPFKLALLWRLVQLAQAAFQRKRELGEVGRLDPALGGVVLLAGLLGAVPNREAADQLQDLRLMRRRWSECKSNLKYWYTAERSYYVEKDKYSEDMPQIGYEPERGNRYAYFASRTGEVATRDDTFVKAGPHTGVGVDTEWMKRHDLTTPAIERAQLPASLAGGVSVGLTGPCPERCNITAVCAANLDRDPALDVWSISTQARTLPDGGTISEGELFHEVDDAEE